MQWFFLVLALLSALVELQTGTFFLAAVAAAALLTTLVGFWIRDDLLILVFLLLCGVLVAAVLQVRRKRPHSGGLVDFDIGQSVSVLSLLPPGNHLLARYRGTTWEAVMEDGAVVAPGDVAIIVRKTDKLLHLVRPPTAAQT